MAADSRPRGHNRSRTPGGRYRRISIRLTADEYTLLAAAASTVRLTPAGFTAHAALNLATDLTEPTAPTGGSRRGELAALQRELVAARTAIHALTQALHTGDAERTTAGLITHCRQAVTDLDTVTAGIHRHLRGDHT
jgi:hypothetical protein